MNQARMTYFTDRLKSTHEAIILLTCTTIIFLPFYLQLVGNRPIGGVGDDSGRILIAFRMYQNPEWISEFAFNNPWPIGPMLSQLLLWKIFNLFGASVNFFPNVAVLTSVLAIQLCIAWTCFHLSHPRKYLFALMFSLLILISPFGLLIMSSMGEVLGLVSIFLGVYFITLYPSRTIGFFFLALSSIMRTELGFASAIFLILIKANISLKKRMIWLTATLLYPIVTISIAVLNGKLNYLDLKSNYSFSVRLSTRIVEIRDALGKCISSYDLNLLHLLIIFILFFLIRVLRGEASNLSLDQSIATNLRNYSYILFGIVVVGMLTARILPFDRYFAIPTIVFLLSLVWHSKKLISLSFHPNNFIIIAAVIVTGIVNLKLSLAMLIFIFFSRIPIKFLKFKKTHTHYLALISLGISLMSILNLSQAKVWIQEKTISEEVREANRYLLTSAKKSDGIFVDALMWQEAFIMLHQTLRGNETLTVYDTSESSLKYENLNLQQKASLYLECRKPKFLVISTGKLLSDQQSIENFAGIGEKPTYILDTYPNDPNAITIKGTKYVVIFATDQIKIFQRLGAEKREGLRSVDLQAPPCN